MAVNYGNKMVRNCPFFCLALRAQSYRRQRPGSGREKQEGRRKLWTQPSHRLFVFSPFYDTKLQNDAKMMQF